jgi:hypothetical protein
MMKCTRTSGPSHEGAAKIIADPRSNVTVEAFARHKNEHGHEAVETVAPRQYAHARPLVELQDGERKMIKRVFVHLEQFVARIMLQHVG